jgi:hypothetical protein
VTVGIASIVSKAFASRISHSSRAGPLRTENLPRLARLPNIAVKLTGSPSHADDAYPFERLDPHYRAMFGAFRAVPTLAK